MLELRRFLSVLPARAGMILVGDLELRLGGSAPRTSGDDPSASSTASGAVTCSPHERG